MILKNLYTFLITLLFSELFLPTLIRGDTLNGGGKSAILAGSTSQSLQPLRKYLSQITK
jgi:hypothetical protein